MVGDSKRVAVILEAARPSAVAPLLIHLYGLTRREEEIAGLVLQGYSTAEIAEHAFISPLTVQEHLKRIFAKSRVSSRRELVRQLFLRHDKEGSNARSFDITRSAAVSNLAAYDVPANPRLN